MGISRDNFTKYPRTPHLFGSTGTDDDRHLGESRSHKFLNDPSLIVEEKLDGTNVGIHFDASKSLVLQCRGHLITAGMHPQYDLFKQWAHAKSGELFALLDCRFILFGEWLYAKHTIGYQKLPHYFFEFDIYDKRDNVFLDFDTRMEMLSGTSVHTVPVVHRGGLKPKQLAKLVTESQFDSQFIHPETQRTDALMEGLYLRIESNGIVTGRAKFVRPEFIEAIKQSSHWQYREMIANQLSSDADIWG